MNKPNVSILTEIRRFCASKLSLANPLLAIPFIGARGRMRLLLGLVAFASGGALAAAQTPGCAPNTANYPCAYVANNTDNTVSVINATTNSVITTVAVGTSPEGLAITPDNTSVYVANTLGQTVSVIDARTSTVKATVALQGFPSQIAITPDGAFAYVAEPGTGFEFNSFIEVIDTSANQVVSGDTITGLTQPTAIVVAPNGLFAYAADTCPSTGTACVDVIDTSTHQVQTTVTLPNSLTFQSASIAVSPDGSLVYVTDVQNNGPNTESFLVAISTSTNQIVSSYATTLNVYLSNYGVTVTPDSSLIYFAMPALTSGTPSCGLGYIGPCLDSIVVWASDGSFDYSPQVGNAPTGTALTPDGASVYVTNAADNTVSIVNTKSRTVTATIPVGRDPQGIAAMQVPVATLSQTALNFGNQAVGTTSALQPVSITNTGIATLVVSSIAIGGANPGDFAQTNDCTTLLPSASCNVQIDFTPTATGVRNATLSITDNAPGSPQTVTLSGTGVAFPPTCTLAVQGASTPLTVTATVACTDPQNALTSTVVDWGDGSPTTSIPSGSGSASHTYAGAGTSTVTVTATDAFELTGSASVPVTVGQPQAPPVFPGQSSSASLGMTVLQASLGKTVTFSCPAISGTNITGSELPSKLGITCTFTPPFLTLNNTSVNVAIVIQTTGSANGFLSPPFGRVGPLYALFLPLQGLTFLVLCISTSATKSRRASLLVCVGLLTVLLGFLVACGGGFTPPPGSGGTTTAPGSYFVTVVATDNSTGFVQTSLIVPLTVSPTP